MNTKPNPISVSRLTDVTTYQPGTTTRARIHARWAAAPFRGSDAHLDPRYRRRPDQATPRMAISPRSTSWLAPGSVMGTSHALQGHWLSHHLAVVAPLINVDL
jgi:hypothetical protein